MRIETPSPRWRFRTSQSCAEVEWTAAMQTSAMAATVRARSICTLPNSPSPRLPPAAKPQALESRAQSEQHLERTGDVVEPPAELDTRPSKLQACTNTRQPIR